MPIKNWSTTASNNNSSAPYGFPEGMPPSALNDASRQVMADVRAWYEDAIWADLGLTPTRLSSSQFSVPGDYTSQFTQYRALRFTGSSTTYGGISTSSYGAGVTTVTMLGSVIPATLTTVSLAGIDTNSLPANTVLSTQINSFSTIQTITASGSHLTLFESDGSDPSDRVQFEIESNVLRLGGYDASVPTWRYYVQGNVSTGNTILGNTAGVDMSGNLRLTGTAPNVLFYESDAADPADAGAVSVDGNTVRVYGYDNSAAATRNFLVGDITTGQVTLGNAAGVSIAQNLTVTGTITSGGTAVVLTNDSRLSDARTPTAHTHATADITSGTFASARISQASVTQHQAALSIAGSQLTGSIADGLLSANIARLGSAANFTSTLQRGGLGVVTSSNGAPNITRGTTDPTGGSDGDIYLQYT